MMKPDVSIIIPVHNAEQHLDRCLESVRGQVGPSLEILCVDDASTDNSAALIDALAGSDERVRTLRHASNLGPGAARNTGMAEATGEYLMFVDADDTLVPGALAHLHALASEHGCDLVKGAYEEILEGGESRVARWSSSRSGVLRTRIADSALLQSIPGPHCSYLVSRSLVEDRGVRYPTDLVLGEDLVYVAHALLSAKTVTLTPEVVYRYHQVGPSLSRGPLGLDALLAAVEQKRRIAELMRTRGFDELADRQLSRWNHQVRKYWPQMVENLSFAECQTVFRSFRAAVPPGVIPWNGDTPEAHRNVLALVLLGDDRRACDALLRLEDPSSSTPGGDGEAGDSAVQRWIAHVSRIDQPG